MVYVLNKNGQPIMPTKNHAKVRVLLKQGKAKVVSRCPFTIQLQYNPNNYTQPVILGIDAGSKHIGVSATIKTDVLYEGDVELRNDIVNLLSTRRELRSSRRNRKTRYRKARFNNRTHERGWLAPSVQQKVNTHLTVVNNVCKFLPITSITVEVASFDIQKIKNPLVQGIEYQQGEQLDFWNTREYVLFRDGHLCQCCKGKSKDKVLNVHHIESRKIGGNAPNNLITLCETCHTGYHAGTVTLPKTIKRGMSFRDATFMGIMRWAFYDRLKSLYEPKGVTVRLTYGYITKDTRIANKLPKEHFIDARCISGNPTATSDGTVYYQKKVRCHNRQIHKSTISKGGYRKLNQAPYMVKGFRLFDKVLCKGNECFIFGRRSRGSFSVRQLDGTHISDSISYRKLKFLQPKSNYITERRRVLLPTASYGVSEPV